MVVEKPGESGHRLGIDFALKQDLVLELSEERLLDKDRATRRVKLLALRLLCVEVQSNRGVRLTKVIPGVYLVLASVRYRYIVDFQASKIRVVADIIAVN